MIRVLSDNIVNQIAAGEVIERPFSAVKELLENAIDSGATAITTHIRNGGKSYMRISDNGCGISREELPLALQRHATSKLNEDDLFAIKTLGFRGEALPSIGSVSRMRISSRAKEAQEAWQIALQGGAMEEASPASAPQNHGTVVEVRDLFYATPARLKFMRSDRAENAAIIDVINRLAMAYPYIAFTLFDGDKKRLDYGTGQGALGDGDEEAFLFRLRQVMGSDFSENAFALDAKKIDAQENDIKLSGYGGLPTLNRATSMMQFLFVNDRPIKDRQMLGAVRAAYADFLARGRYPLVVLYISLDAAAVDVNVHPQKTDVRFRDAAAVRGLLVSGLKHALAEAGFRASGTIADTALGYAKTQDLPPNSYTDNRHFGFQPAGATREQMMRESAAPSYNPLVHNPGSGARSPYPNAAEMARARDFAGGGHAAHVAGAEALAEMPSPNADVSAYESSPSLEFPLGAAMAQLHENYIIAQTADGIVIVDQHAAHERILYEKMKRMLDEGKVAGQGLLSPEIVDLGEEQAAQLLRFSEDFAALGLVMESFGPGAVAIRETPALLGTVDVAGLVRDLADEILEYGSAFSLKEKLQEVFATMACHSSIRSGRRLLPDEMNALLREMEVTPHAGQCNHGRPTYVELKLKDIEVLFGRR